MTDIGNFLKARLEELRQRHLDWSLDQESLDLLESLNKVVDQHEKWPVLVERNPEPLINTGLFSNIDSMNFQISRQMAWLTEQNYIQIFGVDPPTAPIMRLMVQTFKDHPDFDKNWLID